MTTKNCAPNPLYDCYASCATGKNQPLNQYYSCLNNCNVYKNMSNTDRQSSLVKYLNSADGQTKLYNALINERNQFPNVQNVIRNSLQQNTNISNGVNSIVNNCIQNHFTDCGYNCTQTYKNDPTKIKNCQAQCPLNQCVQNVAETYFGVQKGNTVNFSLNYFYNRL